MSLILPPAISTLVKSLRIRWHGIPLPSECVVAFWHSRMVAGWRLARKNGVAIVSQSRDGDHLTSVLEQWHYMIVRGSSSKGGMEALEEAMRLVKEKKAKRLVITPDGPRGPREEFKRGAFIASKELGLPLIFLHINYRDSMTFMESWDKFEVPYPFSFVDVTAEEIDPHLSRQKRTHRSRGLPIYRNGSRIPVRMTTIDLLNPYAWLMALRRALYKNGALKSYKPNVPVISIGNLTSGGTGKTPITSLIAIYIRDELGLKPAIVMRGYKRSTKGFLLVSDGREIHADVNESGDEAQDYARKLGGVIVICDEDRVRGAEKAIFYGGQIILLDDGYQHMRIARDCNILLIDRNSTDNVIPFGKNREDLSTARDADIILLMDDSSFHIPKRDDCPVLKATAQIESIELFPNRDAFDLEALRGANILLIAGIANPLRAQKMVESLGASVTLFPLSDHAEYSEQLIHDIYGKAVQLNSSYILTTTKDIVKAGNFYQQFPFPIPVGIIHITYDIESKEIFFEKIRQLINIEQ